MSYSRSLRYIRVPGSFISRALIVAAFGLLILPQYIFSAQNGGAQREAHPPLQVASSAQPGVVGLTPAQVRRAYGFDQIQNKGAGQIIGIVDAFDHPNIEDDLAVFSNAFGLPPCTTANGCFQKVYLSGTRPRKDSFWALEIALDVEWAHAIAPEAKILLIEAPAAVLNETGLLGGVDRAVQMGASVVTMSWGVTETIIDLSNDHHFLSPGVLFVAAAGDTGTGSQYPAASPFVIGVGTTTLSTDAQGNYLGETADPSSGGGLSCCEIAPSFQVSFLDPSVNPLFRRGVPDVAFNGNPQTGYAIYDSVPPPPAIGGFKGWLKVGGSSVAAPQWAALLAIANSSRAEKGKGPLTGTEVLYDAAKGGGLNLNYHDITSGSNGSCGAVCTAVPGYDYVTGLGSPKADRLIPRLTNQ